MVDFFLSTGYTGKALLSLIKVVQKMQSEPRSLVLVMETERRVHIMCGSYIRTEEESEKVNNVV
jgi:hypothetical protein